jgi:class 3 adenylate cyclase
MARMTTVVFADLTGSTGVFELLGNEKATQAITRLTTWIGQVCESHRGRVVKNLGDGVLAVFADGHDALQAVIQMQREHHERIEKWPPRLRMKLQVGVAAGEVVEVDNDCYGDAVNVASRLSDLSGAEQIWATDTVIEQLPGHAHIRYRSLGPVAIRGKVETRVIYRVEWQEEVVTDFLTMPAGLQHLEPAASRADSILGKIELSWLDVNAAFQSDLLPIHLGRVNEAEFMVNDQRVSRLHARIDWRSGVFVLTDLSSYGTWVRFFGSQAVLALRRDECVLTGDGEIALGAPFEDFTVPTISFRLSGSGVKLAHKPR